jgi:hypothetical protein
MTQMPQICQTQFERRIKDMKDYDHGNVPASPPCMTFWRHLTYSNARKTLNRIFTSLQVFNHKQSCTGRALSRAICWYVLMLLETSERQLALMSSWRLLAPPQSDTATAGATITFPVLCVMPSMGLQQGCGTLKGANVPVCVAPNICSI